MQVAEGPGFAIASDDEESQDNEKSVRKRSTPSLRNLEPAPSRAALGHRTFEAIHALPQKSSVPCVRCGNNRLINQLSDSRHGFNSKLPKVQFRHVIEFWRIGDELTQAVSDSGVDIHSWVVWRLGPAWSGLHRPGPVAAVGAVTVRGADRDSGYPIHRLFVAATDLSFAKVIHSAHPTRHDTCIVVFSRRRTFL
jgi:hypothetical protein